MSLVISVYSEKSFKEYLLPSLNNSDYSIRVPKETFGLRSDLILDLEVMDHEWSLKSSSSYTVYEQNKECIKRKLEDNLALKLKDKYYKNISLIIKEQQSPFRPFSKYHLDKSKTLVIGKDPANDIVYNFMGFVSHKHAEITYNARWELKNHSPNGVYVNGVRIDNECVLKFGDYINVVGLHMIFLEDVIAIDTGENAAVVKGIFEEDEVSSSYETAPVSHLNQSQNGKTIYQRAPRHIESISDDTVEIEAPPASQMSVKQSLLLLIGPSVTMALPMLLGCMLMIYAYGDSMQGRSSLFMYSGLVMAVSSTILGVMWALAGYNNQKKQSEEEEQYRKEQYGNYIDDKVKTIQNLFTQITNSLKRNYPAPSVCLGYDEKGGLLWSRNRTHKDFLLHRLGIGDIPFPINIKVPEKKFTLHPDPLADKPQEIKEKCSKLLGVPVTLDIQKNNLIGIIGEDGKAGAFDLVKVLASQIAANNCYTDVKLCFIYDDKSNIDVASWHFAKWLPHVWSEDRKIRYVASDKESRSDVLYELTNILRTRVETYKETDKKTIPKPYYVVFVSDPSLLEGESFSKYAYECNPGSGLTTVLMVERYEQLPNNCEFIIENTNKFHGFYNVSNVADTQQEVRFDAVSDQVLMTFARHLASLKVLEIEEGGEIPDGLTYFDMLGVTKPSDLPIQELWAKNRIYENIRGMIGVKAGGAPCYLDVHEKYHGPHGLVAGTTGSGKSETLQTYMLSLAVNYSPDDIAFFIIDYKGGGMANLFDGLPHLAGQISNLSGNQVRRAMISIKSENRRRQRLFNEAGVNNINNYTKLYKSGETTIPVPHLFIIIDEFAELKREEPEFMRELISVAQVGRSLGVHLILATQKPSGTVDDNIWSNSKFRLCLRVQDKQDSMDMLHKPDAAYITQAGRCYLQVGNDEVYELFQSGYSGAPYNDDPNAINKNAATLISINGRAEITGASIRRQSKINKAESSVNQKTQLDAVKEYLSIIANDNNYNYKHQLWLPVLSEKIYLNQFQDYNASAFIRNNTWNDDNKGLSLKFVAGLVDDPENQAQIPLVLDLSEVGNIAICGSVACGKSTLLQTISYSLINRYTPEQINLYAFDFSSKMMSAFESAPQFGGVLYENDDEKIARFFSMIKVILENRKRLMRGGDYKQYIMASGNSISAIVIMIDNYSSFKEKTEEKYEDILIQLSKEGISHGIYMIVTGGGFGINDITARVGENISTILTLSLQDKFAYADMLRTMQIDIMPETGIKGRGLVLYGKRALEYQAALAEPAENDYQRLEKIRSCCEIMNEKWKGQVARPVPEIPAKPLWVDFSMLEEYKLACDDKTLLPVGYEISDASVFSISLRNSYCLGIYGPKINPCANFLKVCVKVALDKKAQVCVFDSPEENLIQFRENSNVEYIVDEEGAFNYFTVLLNIFKERNGIKNRLLSEDYDDDEVFEYMNHNTDPVFIIISDLAWFVSMIYNAEHDMKGFLENIVSKGTLHNIYFIADMEFDSKADVTGYKLFDAFTDYQTGIQFGGKVIDDPLLNFDDMPYSDQSLTIKDNIGIVTENLNNGDIAKIVSPVMRRNTDHIQMEDQQ